MKQIENEYSILKCTFILIFKKISDTTIAYNKKVISQIMAWIKSFTSYSAVVNCLFSAVKQNMGCELNIPL